MLGLKLNHVSKRGHMSPLFLTSHKSHQHGIFVKGQHRICDTQGVFFFSSIFQPRTFTFVGSEIWRCVCVICRTYNHFVKGHKILISVRRIEKMSCMTSVEMDMYAPRQRPKLWRMRVWQGGVSAWSRHFWLSLGAKDMGKWFVTFQTTSHAGWLANFGK